jgi:hypothetical protein
MATTAQVHYTYTPLRCEAVHDLTRLYSDIETYVINNDRTLFSRLAHKYESAIVHLLAQHEVDGIPPATLRAFQESYASTAFHCRFPHCDRLSLGFATAELRLEHEIFHVQRVYCQTVSCQYSRIGFAKRSALNTHTRKLHGQPDILRIPAKVRRTTIAGAEVGAKTQDFQTVEVEPQVSYAPLEPNPYMQMQDKVGTPQFAPLSNALTDLYAPNEIIGEEEFSTIKCICGFADDDGHTVLCEKCDTWQHVVCYYEFAQHVPDVHECTDCAPRSINSKRASDRQRERREDVFQQKAYWMTTAKNS